MKTEKEIKEYQKWCKYNLAKAQLEHEYDINRVTNNYVIAIMRGSISTLEWVLNETKEANND